MGIQFGTWNFDGQPVAPDLLEGICAITSVYDPGTPVIQSRGSLGLLLHTDLDGDRNALLAEFQPRNSKADVVVVWGGRLDNAEEMASQLHVDRLGPLADSDIVKRAYQSWGSGCFRKLVGDWAVAIWDAVQQRVLLARDFAGIRQLYFSRQTNSLNWCTVLDPLLHLQKHSCQFCDEYLVGYLSTLPQSNLTPYLGISAVPAGSFVVVEPRRSSAEGYWRFNPAHRTRYSNDADYEEHFRVVLRQSVKRRLRSSAPVFAELSGGMDSSSIVCMADSLCSEGDDGSSELQTISYYDESEPNWDEAPYFSIVEQQRGRQGKHLNLGSVQGFLIQPDREDFCPLPGRDRFTLQLGKLISDSMPAGRLSVLLSGLGGDEFLGGVPNPVAELQDLFVQLRWLSLLKSVMRWSLERRRPWFHLLFDTTEEFLPQAVRRLYKQPRIPPWISHSIRKQYQEIIECQMSRVTFHDGSPSFQANVNTFEHISRQLGCYAPTRHTRFTFTYPYLDRDLLEFLFSVPRSQILRPGQRRSLMKRSLAKILPEQILQRRRKAYVSRSPIKAMQELWPVTQGMFRPSLCGMRGIIDDAAFVAAMERAFFGDTDWLSGLITTMKLEQWLRAMPETNGRSSRKTATPIPRPGFAVNPGNVQREPTTSLS